MLVVNREEYSVNPKIIHVTTTSEQISNNRMDGVHSHLESSLPRKTQPGQERATEGTGTQEFKNIAQGTLLKIQQHYFINIYDLLQVLHRI